MKELEVKEKQAYLNENYPFSDIPEVSDRKKCIHCGDTFIVGNYKVFTDDMGDEFIFCPNAPKCGGSVIDWVDE